MRQSLLSRKTASSSSSPSFAFVGNKSIAYDTRLQTYIEKGYQFNDIVYSVIRLIVDKCQVAPWGIYTVEDEQAYKQLKAILRKSDWAITDYVRVLNLQHKALRPVTNTGKWGDLMQYANDREGHSEYVANNILFKLVTGNSYTLGQPLEAGANAGVPNQLINLYSPFVGIEAITSIPLEIQRYNVTSGTGINLYQPEEVLHERFFNPNFNDHNAIYGQSPLKAALRRLQKNNSLTDAEVAMFENQGIKGILHLKAQPGQVADEEGLLTEVGRLKNTVTSKEWTGTKNWGRIGVSGYDMGWIPIGFTNKEMEMSEAGREDLRYICNIYGVPSQLLNDPENKTYNNLKEAEKALTLRCVLPHLCHHKDRFNYKAKKDWGFKQNWVYDFDMTAFGELAADAKEVAAWTQQMIAMVPNLQLELAGLSAIDDPILNEPWVQSIGRMPLSDYGMNQVDNALNNQNSGV